MVQNRTGPCTVKSEEEEEETQYDIMTKYDEAGYMLLAKEEERIFARVSGRV